MRGKSTKEFAGTDLKKKEEAPEQVTKIKKTDVLKQMQKERPKDVKIKDGLPVVSVVYKALERINNLFLQKEIDKRIDIKMKIGKKTYPIDQLILESGWESLKELKKQKIAQVTVDVAELHIVSTIKGKEYLIGKFDWKIGRKEDMLNVTKWNIVLFEEVIIFAVTNVLHFWDYEAEKKRVEKVETGLHDLQGKPIMKVVDKTIEQQDNERRSNLFDHVRTHPGCEVMLIEDLYDFDTKTLTHKKGTILKVHEYRSKDDLFIVMDDKDQYVVPSSLCHFVV